MALRAFTATAGLYPSVAEPADSVEAAVVAVEEVEEAETEAAALRVVLGADITILVNEEAEPTRDAVLSAIDRVREHILRTNLYTPEWYAENE